jgi:hypothetical protein
MDIFYTKGQNRTREGFLNVNAIVYAYKLCIGYQLFVTSDRYPFCICGLPLYVSFNTYRPQQGIVIHSYLWLGVRVHA